MDQQRDQKEREGYKGLMSEHEQEMVTGVRLNEFGYAISGFYGS
jgi:hypothetical protein